jgi:hypothetical protein
MRFLGWLKNGENLVLLRAFQSLFTVGAIVAGGIWTYMIFVKRRQRYPRANITQQIRHFPLPNNKVLLRATVRICNEGKILLPLVSGFSRVQQMIPCSDDLCEILKERDDGNEQCEPEAEWPLLSELKLKFEKGEREVEPGETDELHFDFVIDSDVQVIVVYSYLKNAKKRRLGWNATSIYDLRVAL